MKASEATLARVVVAELQRQGYDTYEEVSTGYCGHRADIVAIRGPVLAVIECKATFSLKLLNQLTLWRGHAHLIVGAHGFSRGQHGAAVQRYCRLEGFGMWSVGAVEISEYVSPRLYRVADVERLRKLLRAEQQSAQYAKAGTTGGYFTPFRGTVDGLKRIVAQQPGIELRAAIKAMKHHYSNDRSALSAIPELIKRGVIVGLRCEGKPMRMYPDEA